MKRWWYAAGLLAALFAGSARGAEPYLEFLQALQKAGQGEMALEYLTRIEGRADLPGAIKEVIDLERSKSLRIAAAEAYDAEQRKERIAQADKLLEKFLKDHPAHPAAALALMASADDTLLKAQISFAQSRAAKETLEQETLRKQAREQFSAGADQLGKIHQRLLATEEKLGPAPEDKPLSSDRLELQGALIEVRMKLALADYYLALTYPDPKDATRKKHLSQAAKIFDAIFQKNREVRAGFFAHTWHGKTLEELGDETTAMDIYDEVLVAAPDKSTAEEDAAIFAQAALFRLRLVAKTAALPKWVAEGEEWLNTYKTWQKTPAYQGMALEVAKGHLAMAAKASGAEQKNRYRQISAALAEIGKVESDVKQEALLLRRQVQEKLGTESNTSSDEQIAIGDAAANEKQWAEATAAYERALATAEKTKNMKLAETAKQRLTQVRYQLAVELYTADKHDEALKAAGAIVRDAPQDPVAVQASNLAVACALALYSSAKEDARPAALERLERVAKYTIEHWPNKAEADDARMALARAKLTQNDENAALEVLQDLNPRSKRYPLGRQLAGQILWRRYMQAKKADAEAKETIALRQQARKMFKESYLSFKEDEELIKQHAEPYHTVSLLLAEASLEDQAAAEAAPLFAELLKEREAAKSAAIDPETKRIFIGAVRAQLASGNVDEAGQAALKLAELSEDNLALNSVLIDFSKLIGVEVRKADAEVTRLGGTAQPEQQLKLAIEKADATKKVLETLVRNIAERKNLSLASMIYLGDTAALLNIHSDAQELYERALAKIDKPEPGEDLGDAAKAAARIRAQLIALLRNKGQYDEANKQVDALIKTHPKALEPLMEKGRILQAWAEKDPKKYGPCVEHWTSLRVTLGRIKTRPPEYYEVLYNSSYCLWKESLATKDPAKTLQAEQILKSTLTLSPALDGPDTVEKFKALLAKIEKEKPAEKAKARPAVNKK